MNKANKIRINYLIGGIITCLLLWAIYEQVKTQINSFSFTDIFRNGVTPYFILCILLMPVNILLEAYKWKLLVSSAQQVSFITVFKSYLAGLALSILTPNRIGEYPGRLMYLKQKNTPRLISVMFLGMFTQFLCLFIFGIIGLVYYNYQFPGYPQKIALIVVILFAIAVSFIFMNFEKWSRYIERFSFFKKFKTYNHLLKKFSFGALMKILFLSIIKFVVYVLQYLVLLKWMNIDFVFWEAFCLAGLFFFSLAIVPSIALAELGIRGQLGIFFFQHITPNKIGILIATLLLWMINLILPSILGSLLWIKNRILR